MKGKHHWLLIAGGGIAVLAVLYFVLHNASQGTTTAPTANANVTPASVPDVPPNLFPAIPAANPSNAQIPWVIASTAGGNSRVYPGGSPGGLPHFPLPASS